MEKANLLLVFFLFVALSLFCEISGSHSSNDDTFYYGKGSLPWKFRKGNYYPTNSEELECRPIKIHVARGTKRYRDLVTFSKSYRYLHFSSDDARRMSSRLYSRLSKLAVKYYKYYRVKLLILKAWAPYPDNSLTNTSLHYEGRSIQIHVTKWNVTRLLRLAINYAEFDWVIYEWEGYARLSVIPDACDANLDVVFVMDQSGSIGPTNHKIALNFLSRVVDFFNIGSNLTQVSLVTYSTYARVRFDLNDFDTKSSILHEISRVRYTGGWTATALGLFQAGVILNPIEQRGARPIADGIPRVVILLTDGRSNRVPIDEVATSLHDFGVQVYTVGIGNIYLPELKFIASDPDPYHIFLLDSFSDAGGFVDFLSYTTCDTPAVVEPGENTTTEVPEDGFRFFQTECTAFSVSVVIEQIDIYGKCSLYASTSKPNPGPLDSRSVVVRNEDIHTNRRIVVLKKVKKFIYISIRGIKEKNMFTVIIWDRIFRLENYTVSVPEGVANHAFFNLTAEVTVTTEMYYFRIKEGNDNNDFKIDNITGILSTNNELSTNRQQNYRLVIIVENRNASCHRGKVVINVIVTPNQLEFEPVSPVNITETRTGNVTRVRAVGTSGTIIYSIIGGNVGNAFTIDSSTGDIGVVGGLDFETTPRYDLIIQASSGGSTTSVVQIINIEDVNERPIFVTQCAQMNLCTFAVFENSPISTLVDTIVSRDPDSPNTQNGQLTYTLSPSNIPFAINNTGSIIVTGPLDAETVNLYRSITVTVSDNGSPSLSISTLLFITISDRNDNSPVFTSGNTSITIPENTPLNTVITRYRATDRDVSDVNSRIIFSLQSTTPVPFIISTDGILTVSGPLDFDNGPQVYDITIIASNPDGLSTSRNVTIQLTDVNDNSPQFTISPITASVVEHSSLGTFVARVEATDIDSGSNGEIVYSLISATNLFTINNETGVISVNGDIDREMVTMLTLTVIAQDLGSPNSLSNTTTITITVLDINDNAPIFMPNILQISLPEDTPLGPILSLNASDDDQPNTPNSTITYSITGGNINNHFSIDSSTGVLSLISSLDFEEIQSFNLTILGRDGGNPSMSGTANVFITVTNINDHPPVITGNITITLPEDQPVGSILGQFNATDLDQMHVKFCLANPSTLFAVNITTGEVTLINPLDFETSNIHIITVIANDSVHVDQATLTVNVLDINEFSPVFISDTIFSIDEGRPSGTVLGTIQATDGDTSNILMYFLLPNTVSGLFSLNSTTGVLTTATVLDREGLVEENHFLPPGSNETLVVMAIDNGQRPGPRSSQENIIIILNDINDNTPVFNPSQYTENIPENTNVTTVLLTAQATDADLGNNGDIRYSIPTNVSNDFSIDPVTGVLSAIRPFDREGPNNVFNFIITATDQGDDIQLSSTASVIIRVTDVNDNPPVFAPDSYVLEIREDTPFNRVIKQIFVTDIDTNIAITIIGRDGTAECPQNPPSTNNCFFSVNSNGIIRVARPLDYETISQHNITLTATDSGSPSLSTTQLLIINIINIDERAPEFLDSCNATVLEGVPVGTLVSECQARDFDEVEGEFTNDIRYSIIAGNEEQIFAIDEDTGNITTNGQLDRERQDSYTITVQAMDDGNLATTMEVTITVGDINDNTPVLDGPYTVLISDTDITNYRTTIVTVTASDGDIGNNADIRYNIINNDIDEDETILTISANDQGTPIMLSSNTTVNITFETPCTSQTYSINTNTGEITAILLCSIEVTPPLIQVNVGDNFTLSCDVLRNVDVTVQFLHNGSSIGTPTPLTSGVATATFTRTNILFDNAGFYDCRAGTLQTSDSTEVQVQVPPQITTGPDDVTASLGLNIAQFVCQANIGVPEPVISWVKDNAVVVANNRFLPTGNTLLISQVQQSDGGEYTCVATNRAGQDRATATLFLIETLRLNLMVAEVVAMSNPDPVLICNSFDNKQFEQVMTQITSHRTMVTSSQGSSLCASDSCHPSPCVNGTCNVTSDGYTCTCTPGFHGNNCDEDIDECKNTTCRHGGTCQNVKGGFKCHCQEGYYGDLCWYNHGECKCPEGTNCIQTDAGNRCVLPASTDHVMIEGVNVQNVIALDNTVNTLLEDPPSSSSRRKRSNGFVTVCSGRFIQLSTSNDQYLLVWVCPDNATPPDGTTLLHICQTLVKLQLVRVCYPPNNGPPVTLPQVPPSSLNVTIVLFDENGNPLPTQQVIDILNSNDILNRMSASGFNVTGFRAVHPVQPSAQSLTSRNIGGSIGGVIGGLIVIVLIAVIVMAVLKYNKRNKRIRVPVIEMNEKGTTINNTMFDDTEDDRYSRVPKRLQPINDTSIDSSLPIGNPSSPLGSPVNPYTLFDEPVYAKPPPISIFRKSVVKKVSTLERAKQHHLQKSNSLEKLLDSDQREDEEVTGHHHDDTQELPLDDEPIYGNMNFNWEGKVAGERWENYWKTTTVLRGTTPPN